MLARALAQLTEPNPTAIDPQHAAGVDRRGDQVRIATSNPEALRAVHEFLRFQIRDHRTGDSLTVPPSP